MGPQLGSFLAVALASIALGVLVILHSPRRLTNRLFSAFALAVALWSFSVGAALRLATTSVGLYSARLAFMAAGLSVFSLLTFLHSFPSPSLFRWTPSLRLLAALAVVVIPASLSPWIARDVTLTPSGVAIAYGPLHLPFSLFVFSCLASSIVLVFQRLKTTRGLERLQTKFLFFGLIIPCILATITNLIVPLFFHRSDASRYGPLFSVLMVLLIAHAILRHRLLEVRVFIRKSVTYTLSVVFTAGALFAALASIELITGPSSSHAPWLEVVVALLTALCFQPIKSRVQKATDKYLYRHTYDTQEVLRDASRRIPSFLDLSSLLSYLSTVITRTTSPECLAAYIAGAGKSFTLLSQHLAPSSRFPLSLPDTSPIPTALRDLRAALSVDDLADSERSSPIRVALEDIGATLVVPMFADQELLALLALGPKRSGDPYYSEDSDLLSIVAGQAALALKNAQLYRQVVDVNRNLDNILSTMESGVIAVDRSRRITLLNRAAANMTALELEPTSAYSLLDLPPSLSCELSDALQTGTPRLHHESTLTLTDGTVIPVVSSTTPFTDSHSAIEGAVIVFNDLTHVKTLEADKRRAERLASLGALASGIAHEIKNPLVAIRTFAELLPERFSDAEFRDSFARVALKEIERIDLLIARLRGLASSHERQLGPLNLIESLDDTLALLRAQLEQKRIAVTRRSSSPTCLILGDAAQLKQLFLNLLLNAVESMHDGGILTIEVENADAGYTALHTVRITDTGVGIPAAVLSRVFDPFVTTKPEGSGLGLAICRNIADAHHATIAVGNRPQPPGTTVTLTFPPLGQMAELLLH